MRKLNHNGSVLVMVTLAFALLGTFVGFALDFGRAYLEKARIARLVDGAALAAAKILKGQVGYQDAATRAACDSMAMDGAPVIMSSSTTCTTTSGVNIAVTLEYLNAPVSGGPDLRNVKVTATELVPTTFLKLLSFMAPGGDYSTITVVAAAQAGPERPIDLMLVLDRSGSMSNSSGSGSSKMQDLKTAVNAFLGLSNTFSANDQIGIVSFATRGCGSGGNDSTVATCVPDVPFNFATSSHITTLQNAVNTLNANGGTNTMEALRTARLPLAAAFNDPSRATTRKAVLLITDGQPTFLKRDNDAGCRADPRNSNPLPSPGDTNAAGGPFTNGCAQGVVRVVQGGNTSPFLARAPLSNLSCLVFIPGDWNSTNCPVTQNPNSNAQLYQNVIRCTRALVNCTTNGAMFEANLIRNCGYNNSGCAGGAHDVVFFAIVIGQKIVGDPQNSADENAKCMLARMANATDILNAATGVVETMAANCGAVFTTTIDGDTHADLLEGWPCGTGPCIDTTQQKGKVYVIDVNGNVNAQLTLVFQEIAQLLKLRLVL